MNTQSEGRTLGKYQLLERLGRGGMADVYRAFQPGLERYVAIKVLHAHLQEGPNFIERFKREARAVAALHHPNIINVFDFDIEGESYYMVMDYVEGSKSLKEVLQEYAASGQRLPLDEALDIAGRVADALDYAHQQGMIHRDVKPSNVLMTDHNTPVLADFGIARMVDETGLTASGAMIGTPAYMSPEQGRGERADERSDIYALGIVLYEMLTGNPPYDADTPYGVILKHINDPIVSPRRVIQNLPAVVEMIVLKSLAKDPNDRFQTAGEMAHALRDAQRILADATPSSEATPSMLGSLSGATEPISIPAAEPTMIEQQTQIPQRPTRRFPWLLVGVGAAILAFVVIAAVAVLVIVRPFSGGAGSAADQAPPLSQTAPEAQAPGGGAPVSSDASDLFHQGLEHLYMGEDDIAMEFFTQALNADPQAAEALAGQSVVLLNRADEPAAAEAAFRAHEINPDSPYVAFALGRIYDGTSDHYNEDAALEQYTRAAEGCGDDARLCAEAFQGKASMEAWAFGNFDAAIADQTHAIEIDPDPYSVPYRMSSRADMFFHGMNDPESAFADLEHAYELEPDYNFLQQAAYVAIRIGDLDRAHGYFDHLIEDHNGEPAFVAGRGYIELLQGAVGDAHGSAERSLALDSNLLQGHYLMALVLMEEGNPYDAVAHLQAIREQEDRWYNDAQYTPGLFTTDFGHELYYDLALATWQAGDPGGALGLIDAGLERDDWVRPYVLRGEILTEQGDLAGARESYLTALDYAYDDPDLQNEIQNRLADLGG